MSQQLSPPSKDTNNNLSAKNFLGPNTSASDIDLCSLISEAKPAAILVNECGEIEIQMNKNHSYFYAYELIFHSDNKDDADQLSNQNDNSISNDKLCCFAETRSGSLLLATEKGIIGIINLKKCMTAWISLIKINCDSFSSSSNLNPNDDLYDIGQKKLIDLCIDNNNDQITILTKHMNRDKPEFKIEVYGLNEKTNEMTLIKILTLAQSQSSSSSASLNEPSEFVRIYLDETENCYVIIDSNNHKVYWYNTSNCQAKRCVKSPDGESIHFPSGLALVNEPKIIYICSQKGMLICRPDHQSVKHDSLKPIDISYSIQDNCIYFIDEYALYRTKVTETMANEQRFKRIFSNKLQNKGFRRVIACEKHIFVMGSESNSLFVIERDHLKIK
ncbi:unnamed protein product [Brachionus calyciflorus]|uniref:Uncharacterized protein n=1 Tax=Brachionus calyciflorus TaxID=104777 RepID=A0A813M0W8_9BILA|nr:unnamed protein product [Brachionus calyciflorus]